MNGSLRIAGTPRGLTLAVGTLIATLVVSGCAFTTGHVNLEYQSSSIGSKIATANSPHVAVNIVDRRPTQAVGEKVNGFGMKTADIVADNDVPDVVKGAFVSELSQRGFAVGPGGNVITVRLENLQNQFTLGWFSGESTANMGMNVTVKRPNGATAYDKYVTGQNQEWIEMGTASNAQETLDAAMQDAVSKVFSDPAFIQALLKP